MKTREFEYLLPEELIAQSPVEPRDSSRLLVLERKSKLVKEDIFRNIIDYLNPGDVLALNDTKVIPARLYARKGSGAKVEIFLLKDMGEGRWEALVKPGSKLLEGQEVIVGDNISVNILWKTGEGSRIVKFPSSQAVTFALKKFGKTPLPPYIKKPVLNFDRYQTVYAKREGSLAAPTAALHFTSELLERLKDKGIIIVYITLHMGWGSFRPIRTETVEDYKLPAEYYEVTEAAAAEMARAKEKGNRIITCGTDTTRAIETAAEDGMVYGKTGTTSLFITHGYKFKIVDVMITNLHLPCSSHLILVSAFSGHEFVFKAYQYAVEKRFRFYTFGDATLII